MAYNVFPQTSAGDTPFYIIFGHDSFMPTLSKLLLSKHRYTGEWKMKNSTGCHEKNIYDGSSQFQGSQR